MRLWTAACFGFSCSLFASAHAAATNATRSNELISELAKLPQCAITCITEALPTSACKLGDFDCLCSDDTYIEGTGNCILSSCSNKQALTTQTWQMKACQAPIRDAGPMARQINIALLVVATLCIAIRFLAKWRIAGSEFGWDDWTIFASWLLLLPSTILMQMMIDVGLGRDIWLVPFSHITLMFKYFYIDQYIYQAVIALTKISIVLLYMRIFPKSVSRRFWLSALALIGGLIAYGSAFIIYCGLQCAPVSYFWNQWDGEHQGHCNNFQLAVYFNSGFNMYVPSLLCDKLSKSALTLSEDSLVVSTHLSLSLARYCSISNLHLYSLFDLLVFFLPIRKLLAIQVTDKRRKVGIVLTFLIGLFVTVCSMVRLKYLSQVSKVTNATYEYTQISLWSAIESEVGVICACMPTIIGPTLNFFRNTFGSTLNSLSKSGTSKTGTTTSYMGDKRVTRLPSETSEGDLELNDRPIKHGVIEKTRETTIYHHPSTEQWSDDDMKLLR